MPRSRSPRRRHPQPLRRTDEAAESWIDSLLNRLPLAEDAGKRAAERFNLIFSAVWIAVFGTVVATEVYFQVSFSLRFSLFSRRPLLCSAHSARP